MRILNLKTNPSIRIPTATSYFIRNKSSTQLDKPIKQNQYYYSESKLSCEIDRNKIPIAIIFGWTASKDRYVLKHSEYYKNMGYHTIRISPSLIFSKFRISLHRKSAEKLISLIRDDLKLTSNPLVIHTFSNSGIFVYRNILELTDSNQNDKFIRDNIKAIIHDSGPGICEKFGDFLENAYELVLQAVKLKILAKLITFVGAIAFTIKHPIFLSHGNDYFSRTFDRLVIDTIDAPTLFLYSKSDRMVYYKEILKYIERRKTLFPDWKTTAIEFEGSEHINHYLKYKKSYLEKIKTHLIGCNLPIYEIK